MKHLTLARECRDFATAFPELAPDLERIESHFLRGLMEKQALFSHLRTLPIRRIEMGPMVDLMADLQRALTFRTNGLQPDIKPLKDRARKIADDLKALRETSQNSKDHYDTNKERLRQAAALLSPTPRDEVASMPEWFSLLGDRNPRTWSHKRLDRSLKLLERNQHLSFYKLEELIIGEFGSNMLGSYGSLGEFMYEAWAYRNSPWFWRADPGTTEKYKNLISAAIGKVGVQGNDVLHVLWKHPKVWRDLTSSLVAAQAMVEAILSICDAITFFAEHEVAFPEESMPVISMNTAIDRLEEAAKTMRDEVSKAFPNRVKFSRNPELGVDADPMLSKVLDARGPTIVVRSFLEFLHSKSDRPLCKPYYLEKVFDWYSERPSTRTLPRAA